jgi:hypothetical protein
MDPSQALVPGMRNDTEDHGIINRDKSVNRVIDDLPHIHGISVWFIHLSVANSFKNVSVMVLPFNISPDARRD